LLWQDFVAVVGRATVCARAVAVLERGNHEVALGDAVHLCPDLFHHADELVVDGSARRVGGLPAVVPEVGATDARQHDAVVRVGRRGDDRVGSVGQLNGARSGVDSSTHRYASSFAREVERFRKVSICSWRSATFCSAAAIASAPATKRHGGGSSLAIVMSACVSFAGLPACRPFWASHYAHVSAVRGA
jgi:hypothetical protein